MFGQPFIFHAPLSHVFSWRFPGSNALTNYDGPYWTMTNHDEPDQIIRRRYTVYLNINYCTVNLMILYIWLYTIYIHTLYIYIHTLYICLCVCASYIFLHEIPWCLVAPGPQILHLGVAVALHLRLQCGLYAVQSWHGAGAEVLQLDGHGHLDLVPCWKHMDLTWLNHEKFGLYPTYTRMGTKASNISGISPREYHGLTLGLLFLAIASVSQPLEHILGCWDVSPTA